LKDPLCILACVSVDPRIGTVIAGCRIEGRLRPGGMSEVFRAEHLHLGRKVALKLLDPRLAQDEGYRQRFLRESRLAAALYHPNIVPIYDAGEADGTPFLMMHLVEGDDLAATIRARGPMDVEQTLSIMGQVVKALDAAHDRGLVHRDVKPGNILIANGEGVEPSGHTYLTDFGLAKQVSSSGTALTRKGLFMGTLDYVAPEQIQGQEVDRRADVYAIACVAYECLAGEVPFPRDSEVAMMYAHMHDAPPDLSAKRPDLPPQVDSVVTRAMAKNLAERYPTAGEFFADLRSALESETAAVVAAPPAAAVEQPRSAEAPVSPEAVAAAPDAAPVAPPLVDVFALDVQGTRFGLGRTATGYAIWDLHAGGTPVRLFPLTDESWQLAWATYHELEASPDPTGEAAVGAPAGEPRPEAMSTSGPSEPLLVGVVFLDYRGQKYALGRTGDSYSIWDLQAGGYPVQTFSLQGRGWEEAWSRYQELEASPAAAPEGVPAASESEVQPDQGPRELVGALAIDYRGEGYALGRSSDAYAIWDVAAGGYPVQVYALDGSGWNAAWQAFQDLEARLDQR
ncbi:MAG: serine/threonine protein kinase, partial [Actinomycetota bacterium]|nr:serine/threonine protein kinase [Actinomycetota bacterium]